MGGDRSALGNTMIMIRRVVVVVVALSLTAACGARVTEQQVASLGRSVSSGQSAAAEQTGTGDSTASGGGSAASSDASGPAQPQTSGGSAAAQQSSAQASTDNGGSTDVGVTADTINLGQVTTMSGPVPGLFAGSAYGSLAYAAYVNSQGGINGRKLKIDIRDDSFDAAQNRAQSQDLVKKVFGIVGGFSTYDDGAVDAIQSAGTFDVQIPLTPALQHSPNNFTVAPAGRGGPTGFWNLFKQKFPDAITHVGGLTADVGASIENYEDQKAAGSTVGYKFVYERRYQVTETDFTADVVRMRQAGVRIVFTNAEVKSLARIVKAMQQQSFKPDAIISFNAGYDANFIPTAGDASEGVYVVTAQAMFLGEDAGVNPEVKLFNEWLQKVKPGYRTDLYSAYGWGSMRLLVTAMQDAGPKLTRGSVIAALKKIDNWDGKGLFSPAGPASKRPSTCFLTARVTNGKWVRWEMPPSGFRCDNSTFIYR